MAQRTYEFLHANPEVGLEEVRARDYIKSELERVGGFEFADVPRLPTEVIAILDTGRSGQVRALRAELDARKLDQGIVEPKHHHPRSTIDGVMHNCGHDAHAAILLGTAAYAARNRASLSGRWVFVFQPAEEIKGGADDIVEDGVLERLGVRAIFAQHSAPGLPVGTVSLTRGTPLAGSWYYTLVVRGRASHAAVPFEGTDTAVVAARLISELSSYPAHGVDIANRPVVIGVSKVETDALTLNALPTTATITGTIRAFEDVVNVPTVESSVVARIRDRLVQFGKAFGVEIDWQVRVGSPPLTNDDRMFDSVVTTLRSTWGDRLQTPATRGMFAEDFAYFTAKVPALYFGLGIAKGELGMGAIHSPEFTIHPEALRHGLQLFVELMTAGAPAARGDQGSRQKRRPRNRPLPGAGPTH